jgi:hypothetical protein
MLVFEVVNGENGLKIQNLTLLLLDSALNAIKA